MDKGYKKGRAPFVSDFASELFLSILVLIDYDSRISNITYEIFNAWITVSRGNGAYCPFTGVSVVRQTKISSTGK